MAIYTVPGGLLVRVMRLARKRNRALAAEVGRIFREQEPCGCGILAGEDVGVTCRKHTPKAKRGQSYGWKR
jgi:hypothetical protein